MAGFVDLVFKPADYISGLFVFLAGFSGSMIFFMMILAGLARFILFACEAYILAALVMFLVKSEPVKFFFGNVFDLLDEKFQIKKKIEKYPVLKNTKYIAIALAAILFAVIFYSMPYRNDSLNTENAIKKETIIEQAQKIDSSLDSDGDGLPDRVELVLGTNSYFVDTDNDGIPDYDELKNGLSPFIASSEGILLPEIYEAIKKEVLNSENTQLEELEKIRLGFIGQISERLCKDKPSAGGSAETDGKKMAESALKEKDSCLCSRIQNDKYRNACFNKLANIAIDMSLCNYIFEGLDAQNYREDCLNTSMLITLDGKYCERMRIAGKQGECFMILGLKTKNDTLCDKVKDQKEKDSCYYEMAIFGKRPDLCDRIGFNNQSDSDRETCKKMVNSGFIPKINF